MAKCPDCKIDMNENDEPYKNFIDCSQCSFQWRKLGHRTYTKEELQRQANLRAEALEKDIQRNGYRPSCCI